MKLKPTIGGQPAKIVRDVLRDGTYVTLDDLIEFFRRQRYFDDIDELIANGHPKGTRSFLRREWQTYIDDKDWRRRIGLKPIPSQAAVAQALLDGLLAEGLIEPQTKPGHYQTTQVGDSARLVKFSARFSRAKAEEAVAGLLQRATEINTRKELTHRVLRIFAFGSYIADTDDLGDIDLVVELARRNKDKEAHQAANQARIKASGRHIEFMQSLFFGQREVELILKAKNPRFSFHYMSDIEGFGTNYQQIFPEKGPILTATKSADDK